MPHQRPSKGVVKIRPQVPIHVSYYLCVARTFDTLKGFFFKKTRLFNRNTSLFVSQETQKRITEYLAGSASREANVSADGSIQRADCHGDEVSP